MTSQILKSVDLIKIQKSRYLENETYFILQVKKIINYTYFTAKNSFVVEVTFNGPDLLSSVSGKAKLFNLYL